MKKKIRFRILELFPKELLSDMFDIQSKKFIWVEDPVKGRYKSEYTASMKSKAMTRLLTEHFSKTEHSFSFPGAGTNRMSILIDGYVYKIALDNDGYMDNYNEFILSKQAQPYVTKTYETNGLISVAEYVTLISYEEFKKMEDKILSILYDLSQDYLIGDMGYTQKNYCNWGYRDDSSDVVILDYGHMHRITDASMITCSHCGSMLHYNKNYTALECMNCGKEDTFMQVKSRLSKSKEKDIIDAYLKTSFKSTKPVDYFDVDIDEEHEEESDMKKEKSLTHNDLLTIMMNSRYKNDEVEKKKTISVEEAEEILYNNVMKIAEGKAKPKMTLETKAETVVNLNFKDDICRKLAEMHDEEAAFSELTMMLIMGDIDNDEYDKYYNIVKTGDYYADKNTNKNSSKHVVNNDIQDDDESLEDLLKSEGISIDNDDDHREYKTVDINNNFKFNDYQEEEIDEDDAYDNFMKHQFNISNIVDDREIEDEDDDTTRIIYSTEKNDESTGFYIRGTKSVTTTVLTDDDTTEDEPNGGGLYIRQSRTQNNDVKPNVVHEIDNEDDDDEKYNGLYIRERRNDRNNKKMRR